MSGVVTFSYALLEVKKRKDKSLVFLADYPENTILRIWPGVGNEKLKEGPSQFRQNPGRPSCAQKVMTPGTNHHG